MATFAPALSRGGTSKTPMKFRTILGVACLGAAAVILGIWLLVGSRSDPLRSARSAQQTLPGAGADSPTLTRASAPSAVPVRTRESAEPDRVHPGRQSHSTSQVPLPSTGVPAPETNWQTRKAPKGQGREESDAEPGVELVIVQMPAAFIDPDPSLVLGQEQIQAIQAIRKSFGDAMSRAGNPSSPGYLDRWLAEQARADELLMAYLGQEAFSKFHQPETE